MVLDKLGNSLRATLEKVAKSVFVDDKLVNELAKDIQRALLQADVNVKLVLKLSEEIKTRALKEKTPAGITKKEHLINIVYEELVKFLGEKEGKIEIKESTKIMLVGLFGSGKTTQAAKLAKYYQKHGHYVALVQTDTYRPAAFEQLKQLAAKLNIPVFGDKDEKDAVKIYKKFEKKLEKFDLVIVDTAGRDALSDELIEELDQINRAVNPTETLLVLSADIGQAAEKQAQAFHDTCGVTGIIVTKLDGTAKGGGALIACSITDAKVKFIGVGEKVEDLEKFKPENFVGRLLGMGDLEALLEKARDAISEEKAEDLGKRFLKGEFNLVDLYEQMEAMKKMGPLNKIVDMIPGFSSLKMPKDALQVQEKMLKKWRFAMDSMTKQELENPDIISAARVKRIAKGAGIEVSEVRSLLKQYKQAKKMSKMLKGGDPQKLMKKLQKGGPQIKFK
ncbi:MAG: Signal recognition particle 54 kDa protein [Candidatus Woesearchaeota archaeon]|nr:Signal recognition particle 54 kDa protein [Candidatus Woesearchaeota archaeon]